MRSFLPLPMTRTVRSSSERCARSSPRPPRRGARPVEELEERAIAQDERVANLGV